MAYKFVNASQLDADLLSVADAIRAKGETAGALSFPAGMVEAIGEISTGVELNFEVVGGTYQPSAPTENMIWIETNVDITGWAFSAAEPDSLLEGMIWFQTDASSQISFSAIRELEVMVYPLSASQYIGGVWTEMPASIYQNSAWIAWKVAPKYLFKAGEGGLVNWTTFGSTASVGSDRISIYCMSVYTGAYAEYQDLTQYETLCVEGYVSEGDAVTVGVSSVAGASPAYLASGAISTGASTTVKINIADINAGYVHMGSSGTNASILNVWLE